MAFEEQTSTVEQLGMQVVSNASASVDVDLRSGKHNALTPSPSWGGLGWRVAFEEQTSTVEQLGMQVVSNASASVDVDLRSGKHKALTPSPSRGGLGWGVGASAKGIPLK